MNDRTQPEAPATPAFQNASAASLVAAAPTVIRIAKKVLPVVVSVARRHPVALSVGIAAALLLGARSRHRSVPVARRAGLNIRR